MNFLTRKKDDLPFKEICAIIETCSNSGVSSFKFKDLLIDFQARKFGDIENAAYQSPGQVTAIPIQHEQGLFRQEEMNLKDEELSEMKITNPYLYEQLLAQRELIDSED